MKLLEYKSGRLTFIEEKIISKRKNYNVVCVCGKIKKIRSYDFKKQNVKSCGCLLKETSKIQCNINSQKHGLTKSELYKKWQNAKERCYNIKNNRFKYYGALNIKICEEWKNDFIKFYDWSLNNGYVVGLSLERIDYTSDYKPENCIWIPLKTQSRNKTNTYKINTKEGIKTLKEFSNYIGFSESSLRHFCERNKIEKNIDEYKLLSQYLAKPRAKA